MLSYIIYWCRDGLSLVTVWSDVKNVRECGYIERDNQQTITEWANLCVHLYYNTLLF